MTHDEIEIAYRHRLLVTIKESKSNPYLKGGVYVICKFGNWYNKKMKTFNDYVAVESPENPRTIYEIDADLIEPVKGFEIVIQKFLKKRTDAVAQACAETLKIREEKKRQ